MADKCLVPLCPLTRARDGWRRGCNQRAVFLNGPLARVNANSRKASAKKGTPMIAKVGRILIPAQHTATRLKTGMSRHAIGQRYDHSLWHSLGARFWIFRLAESAVARRRLRHARRLNIETETDRRAPHSGSAVRHRGDHPRRPVLDRRQTHIQRPHLEWTSHRRVALQFADGAGHL